MTIINIDREEGDVTFSIGDFFLLQEDCCPSYLCQLSQVDTGEVALICVGNGNRHRDPIRVKDVDAVTWEDIGRCVGDAYTVNPVKSVEISYKL